jgi:protein O-mannosyl-transferase
MSERRVALLLFATAAALYAPALANGFAYDDVALIQVDTRAHSLAGTWRYFVEPYWGTGDLGLYRPLTSLSFALDWALSGGSPAWFHFTNVLWNAAACTLAFLLLSTWFTRSAAAAGALLFLVHPVHVEAVANVVGRAELMAATFVLAALTVWSRASLDEPPRLRATILMCGLFLLALLAKESALVLPGLIVLADTARGALRPGAIAAWLRRAATPLAALVAVMIVFLLARTMVTGGLAPDRVDPLLDVASTPGARILTALQVWPVIARLFVFPVVLLADYGPNVLLPATTLNAQAAFGAALILVLVCAGVAAWLRGHGRLAAVVLFVPVALLPVSNLLLPIGVLLAERTLYLPSFALAAAAALALESLAGFGHAPGRLGSEGGRTARGVRPGVVWAGVALVAALGSIRTVARIPDWRSTETIMRSQERDRPHTFRVAWYDARVAVAEGRTADALGNYSRALDMWPHRRHVVTEAAAYAAMAGDLQYARQLSAYAAERWPADVANLRVLAGVALDLGDTVTARQAIGRGLLILPGDSVLNLMSGAIEPLKEHEPSTD